MSKCEICIANALCSLLLPLSAAYGEDPHVAFPKFRMQEIETGLTIGYGVLLVDVNGDGKPDIVVADATRVVWYENPTWKKRIIIEGKTTPDNVSIAAYDIDGDGKIDFALGAAWVHADFACARIVGLRHFAWLHLGLRLLGR